MADQGASCRHLGSCDSIHKSDVFTSPRKSPCIKSPCLTFIPPLTVEVLAASQLQLGPWQIIIDHGWYAVSVCLICMFQLLFPTCQVRVVRFYASWPSLLLLVLLLFRRTSTARSRSQRSPPDRNSNPWIRVIAGLQLQALDRSVPRQTRTIKVIPAGPHLQALRS